ncbi:hypothetical protein SAMN05720487_11414 [Fibrobacter sp. UWT2]|uniref:hypothetical protein n=1 Tax=Fibrobacter sp. UWT2 TaxID=1896224 RepID=UPI000912F1A8|nr:hypothetical protein [Fibrobacter sp. UWT2]SHL44282.1 hypothetical protein SAMN05720487_11414 [Fibrobacter sp. UWT2]
MRTFQADIIRDHFVINDNGRKVLVDTGCPLVITEENKNRIHGGCEALDSARSNVSPDIDEFRGLEYFCNHKVLFDYKNAKVIVADANEALSVENPVAEFDLKNVPGRIVFTANIGGMDRGMVFDTGASITDYMSKPIAETGTYFDTIEDFHPNLGKYTVKRYELPVKVGEETLDVPFGVQPADVEPHVRAVGADGVIGVGLYKKYQVLIDLPGKKMILGR